MPGQSLVRSSVCSSRESRPSCTTPSAEPPCSVKRERSATSTSSTAAALASGAVAAGGASIALSSTSQPSGSVSGSHRSCIEDERHALALAARLERAAEVGHARLEVRRRWQRRVEDGGHRLEHAREVGRALRRADKYGDSDAAVALAQPRQQRRQEGRLAGARRRQHERRRAASARGGERREHGSLARRLAQHDRRAGKHGRLG
eukprot:786004-Prymnesium_polylepis.2